MFIDIKPCGDRALLVVLGSEINQEINDDIKQLNDAIKQIDIPGVEETIPAYCSLVINYAPEKIGFCALKKKIMELHAEKNGVTEKSHRLIHVPCAYGGHFGPDMPFAEKYSGLTKDEIIELHSSTFYRVYMLGFLPGFVYLGGMDQRLKLPRLESPRLKIPRGAVGIGGSQTGVYPMESPGGWRLLGATPMEFYDPCRDDPILCRAGDIIKFDPVSSCDYYDIRSEILHGRYSPVIEERWEENEH